MATQGEKPGQPGALTETAPRDAGAASREPPPDANFIVTKEYRRFTEFADAVRRECYIGLCYGQPGVGKTLSARRYSCWHELGPLLQAACHHFTEGRDRADWHTLLYTPTVSVTPRMVDKELTQLGSAFAVVRTPDPFDPRARASAHSLPPFVELLIIDEAGRLRTVALGQLRDHYDRSQLGMILVGMPGIEKRLACYPQLYSRIGFVHEYRTLSSEELLFVLRHHWSKLNLTLAADDFTDAEAIAARITGGNFRLVQRLFAQIQRIMEINSLATITREVVQTARESLAIGIL